MRIGFRVYAVGAIPILIAAGIAVAALLLLREVDRGRDGAATTGAIYQTLLNAVMARHEYLQAEPEARDSFQQRFFESTSTASADLRQLRALAPRDAGLEDAQRRLESYVVDMRKLVDITSQFDTMMRDMSARSATLSGYGDQARDRQHAASVDNSAVLERADATMRETRDVVDAAYSLRMALAAIAAGQSIRTASMGALATNPGPDDEISHVKALVIDLTERLHRAETGTTIAPASDAETFVRRLSQLAAATLPVDGVVDSQQTLAEAARWADDIVRVYSDKFTTTRREAGRLLTNSVQAQETELAAENISTKLLKQNYRSAAALARHDEATTRAILEGGERLTDILAALPIAPAVHAGMVAAYRSWLDGLKATIEILSQQNALTSNMDRTSTEMIEGARTLAAKFGGEAEQTARSIRWILVLGAAGGLLFGGAAAAVVARSITVPLAALQTEIMRSAHDPQSGAIHRADRSDELGDIARAANTFLREIGRREQSLRLAKRKADEALGRLRETQAELIRSEKLASLGQLVAGVAHEINTPIGVALTTASAVDEEARLFSQAVETGKLSRKALDHMVARTREGLNLLISNLTRSADLILSFKQVAADQVSGQEREFFIHPYLHELLTSLGPMLRKAGHKRTIVCPEDLKMNCAPGALSQVLTNLVVNASVHAFRPDVHGLIEIVASRSQDDGIRLVVSDNGRGIPPDHLPRIFDPFFTTRRSEGSTGLGLHIVYNIVTTTLGGRIDVDSVLDRGTRFIIDLPARTVDKRAEGLVRQA